MTQQGEEIRKLEWAIRLAQADPKSLREGDWLNLKEDLIEFVRASGTSLDLAGRVWAEPKAFQRLINSIQRGLSDHLERLAQVGVAATTQADPKPQLLEDVGIGFPVSGRFIVGAIKGRPYRLLVKTNTIESQVYSALSSYLVSSGIVAGQIRKCPTCGRIFLLKRKPRPDKEFHCNIRCSRLAATRHYRKKKAPDLKAKERERSHRRYVDKQRRKHGPRVRVERRPRKAKGASGNAS